MKLSTPSTVKDLDATIAASCHYQLSLMVIAARGHLSLLTIFVFRFDYITVRQILFHAVGVSIDVPLPYAAIIAWSYEKLADFRMKLAAGNSGNMPLGVGNIVDIHIAAHCS